VKKSYLIVFLLLTFLLAGCVFASNDTNSHIDVSVSDDNVKMGDTIKFTATKNSKDNQAVVFKVNNKTVTNSNNQSKVKPVNNKASMEYTIPDGFRAGKALVTAVSNVNNTRVETNTYFNVEKMNTRFTNISVYRSLNSYNVNSIILDDNNHTMSGSAKVAIKVNGKTLQKNNVTQYFKAANGVLNATFVLPTSFQKRNITLTLVTGDTYSYIGTRHVIENLVDGSIEVKRMNINFINTTITRKENNVKLYSLLVDDNNLTVKDTSKVAVKINGITLQENDEPKYFYIVNGVLNISFDINPGLANRNLNITLVTGDTYSYIGVRKNFTSLVSKYTSMKVSNNISRPYNNITIPVTVTNNFVGVTDGNISVYVNNKLVSTSKYDLNKPYISIDSLDVGTYTVKLVYNSNTYDSCNATITLNVRNVLKTRTGKVASVFVKLYTSVNANDVKTWVNSGITDVYVQAHARSDEDDNLRHVISLTKNTNIKVHAWILTFKESGSWDHSTTHQTALKNYISKIIKIPGVEGVVLDYVRYSGTNPSTTNVTLITNFVRDVYNIIKSYNPQMELSACVFAEKAGTKTYYGQDYDALSKHLDFLLPMAYKYSYNAGTSWLKSVTEYVVNHSSHAKVVSIIQTYKDEEGTQLISKSELTSDINAIMSVGSYGYSLFYKTLIKEYPKIF